MHTTFLSAEGYGRTHPSVSIIIDLVTLDMSTTVAVGRLTTSTIVAEPEEESECEELRLRRYSPLACRVMCFASSN